MANLFFNLILTVFHVWILMRGVLAESGTATSSLTTIDLTTSSPSASPSYEIMTSSNSSVSSVMTASPGASSVYTVPSASSTPPSTTTTPPSTTSTPPSTTSTPPTKTSTPPSTTSTPPSTTSTPPTTTSTPPSTTYTPPSTTSTPPSTTSTPPSTTSTPPSTTSTPPTSTSIPPSTTSTPPSTTSTPPTTSSSPPSTTSSPPSTSPTPPTAASSPNNISSTPPTTSFTPPSTSSSSPSTTSSPANASSAPPTTSSFPNNLSSTPPTTSFTPPSTSFSPPNISSSPINTTSSSPNTFSTPPTTSSSTSNISLTPPITFSSSPNTSSSLNTTSSSPPSTSSSSNTSTESVNASSSTPTTLMTITPDIDPCVSSPCLNGATCTSSNSVYFCTCPNTHTGSNCETAKSACNATSCGVKETCHPDTNVCECNQNLVRSATGECTRPVSFLLTMAVVSFDNITSFEDIVNNPQSQNAVEIKQRITVVLFGVYRRQYGSLFIALVIQTLRLGSLEVDAELVFEVPEDSAAVQPPTPSEAAQVLIEMGDSIGGFTVDPERTIVVDVNECSDDTLNDCSPDAECMNTVGSFTCLCMSPVYTDTGPIELGPGRQCQVANDGLSPGAVGGIVFAAFIIPPLIFFLIYGLITRTYQNVTKKRSQSLARLRPVNKEMSWPTDNDHQGDDDSSAVDHPSDVEMGPVVKSNNDDGTDGAHENEGFTDKSSQEDITNPL